MATLLEFLNAQREFERQGITKSDVKEIMNRGDEDEIERLWKRVEEAGGYDALAD